MDGDSNTYGDIKINVPHDCGNAPKKNLLKELNIAFANGEIVFIVDRIADDVCWNIVGKQIIEGKVNVTQALEQMKSYSLSEIELNSMITHGKEGTVNGKVVLQNQKVYAFCHIYQFTSAGKQAKIKEIISYIIQIA